MGGGGQEPDLQRSVTDRVVFLDSTAIGGDQETSLVRRRTGRRLRFVMMLGAAVLVPTVVGGALWSVVSDRTSASQESAEEDGDVADPEQAGVLASGEGQLADPNDPEFPIDNRYSPVAQALSDVVVAASLGDARNILFGPTQGLDYARVNSRGVSDVRLDASGNWIAAIYMNSFQQEVLIVSAADADVSTWRFEPLAVGINGFAWHPSQPGRIAYALPDLSNATQIADVDLDAERPRTLRYRADFPGQLQVWGDWGFAFNEPGPAPFTSVAVLPEGAIGSGSIQLETLATGNPGRALGQIAPQRLLIDGGESSIVLNLDNAVYEPNVWYDSSGEVFAFAESPSGKYSVGLVGGRGGSAGGKVLLFTAEPVSVNDASDLLFTTSGPSTFDWSDSGRFVAGFQPAVIGEEGGRTSNAAVTVYDLDRGLFVGSELRTLDSGAVADLRLWVDALAFRDRIED